MHGFKGLFAHPEPVAEQAWCSSPQAAPVSLSASPASNDDHEAQQRHPSAYPIGGRQQHTVHHAQPHQRGGDIHTTVGGKNTATGGWVQHQQPDKQRQARRSRQPQPGRGALAQSQPRQVAADDLGQDHQHEETKTASNVHQRWPCW